MWIANIENALADVLQRNGKPEEAGLLFEKAIATLEKPHPTFIGSDLDLATKWLNHGIHLFYYTNRTSEAEEMLKKAAKVLETNKTPDFQDYLDRARRTLSYAQWHLGKKKAARENAGKWMEGYDSRLEFILRFTTEDQRMGWMDWQTPLDMATSFGMSTELAHLTLRTKGIVLDSIIEDRMLAQRSAAANSATDWELLRKTREELRQAWAAAKPDQSQIAKLESQETELQTRMARSGTTGILRRSLQITVDDVQRSIPKDAALVDYFQYYGPDERNEYASRYAAVLFRPDKEPKLLIMPWTAAYLNDALHVFRSAMRKLPTSPRAKDKDLEVLMKILHGGFVAPIEDDVQGLKTLIISADGDLNFLPFATLVDKEGKFLCQRFAIRNVNSVRDLVVHPPADTSTTKTIALYGDANYRLNQPGDAAKSPGDVRAFSEQMSREGKTTLQRLPGSKREIKAVAKKAEAAGWTVHIAQADQATEASLRGLPSPDILHVATHGYFMQRNLPQAVEKATGMVQLDGRPQVLRTQFDPMNRSGIFLAGAENTFEEWSKGNTLTLENDGVLTAAEAGGLDLAGTWLAVLSACDTGMGDAVSGEGVLGLRRAFFYAGVRNVMMSLWPIYDEATVDFVDEFYGRLFLSRDAAAALHETQLSWLVRLKEEQGLWQAIKCSGAFILVGPGK